MAIIGAIPVTLTNGTTADATQVMQDLNFVQSQVNANAAALAGPQTLTGIQTFNGAVVAIDVKTGGVLVFASRPGFDPNPFVVGIANDGFLDSVIVP